MPRVWPSLEKEETHFREYDALVEERRALPAPPVAKPYTFEGPDGLCYSRGTLRYQSQLIVYNSHVRTRCGGGATAVRVWQ